jgi:hypothetical protein
MISYKGVVERFVNWLKGSGKAETWKVIATVPVDHLLSHSKVGHTMLYTFMEEEIVNLNMGSKGVDAKTAGFLVRRNSL